MTATLPESTDGATPLDPDEADGLIPDHIGTHGALNVWEQANILEALTWARRTIRPALADDTVRELHRRMFDRTWTWAGTYRKSDKTVGIHWPRIGTAVRELVDSGQYWLDEAVYPVDEAAIRLHHRLVYIHPFPNGNGRHARMWTDMLLLQHGRPALSWGSADLHIVGVADRTSYIAALRRADDGEFGPLLALLLRGRS